MTERIDLKKLLTIFFLFISYFAFADDTATVQAAISAGSITHGTYNISSPGITVSHNFNGNGSTFNYTSSTGSAFIMSSTGKKLSNCILVGPGDASNPSGVKGVHITADNDTLTLMKISAFTAYGVESDNVNSPVVTYSNISDIGYVGMAFNSTSSAVHGGKLFSDTIDRSAISAGTITQAGLQIRGAPGYISRRWSVSYLRIIMPTSPTDITAECYEHRYGDTSTIDHMTCIGGSIGVSVVRNNFVRVTNSTLTGQSQEGIEYADSNNGYAGGNSISGQLQDGYLGDGGTGAITDTLYNNTINGCARYPVYLHTGSNSIFMSANNITSTSAFASIRLLGAYGVTEVNDTLLGSSTGSYAVLFDTSTGSFSSTGSTYSNFTTKLVDIVGVATTDNISFRCAVTTGTTVGYNISGGATAGSNISLNLPCYTTGKLYLSPRGLMIKH